MAILYLYKNVLKIDLDDITEIERAKRSRKIPVVFTMDEAKNILNNLSGLNKLMASLLYGTGMRLMECVRLRVKDVDSIYIKDLGILGFCELDTLIN